MDHVDDEEPEQAVKDSIPDPSALQKAKKTLSKVPKVTHVLHSQVLGDIIHLMWQFCIPQHGLVQCL